MDPAAKVWTYEDYLRLPDDGKRYEVIDGVLYVSPTPRTLHQAFSKHLLSALYRLEVAGQGWVFHAPMEVRMEGCDPVQPDLVFVGVEQRAILGVKSILGVPKLVVELLSPSTARYDRITKLNRYARSGVPHYWIGDPNRRTLELLKLDGGAYKTMAAMGPGDRHEPPDFPVLLLDIDELFRLIPTEIEPEPED